MSGEKPIVTPAQLIEAAEKYKAEASDPQYVMGAQVFLSEKERWRDYLYAKAKPTNKFSAITQKNIATAQSWLEKKEREENGKH